jgi:hypothetical protein
VIKHAAKNFVWIDKAYSACCTISEKLIAAPKLRTVLQEIQEEEYHEVRGICAHVPTRFGSRHMVMRDLLHSRTAIRRLAAKAEWKASVQESAGMKKAHELINALEDDLFELADKLDVLLGPVMDAIHQLEADQPMLSFIKPVWGKLQKHFAQFSSDHSDEAEGEIPADRRKRNPQPTPISLVQLLEQDRLKLWHPAMDAAAVLDPVFWSKNVRKQYHMPVASLEEDARIAVEELLEGFAEADEDAVGELTQLEVTSFPERYTKVLDFLSARKEAKKGDRVVVHVAPSSQRADFFNNSLGAKVPVVTRAANVLLSMPVTACAAERNWSRWGLTFEPNRNRLGLETAQKLIFVQQNDPATRNKREEDVLVV